jgi:purine-binding chemotaxis protein CheW
MNPIENASNDASGNEYLTFRMGEEEYAIDILRVREIRAHEAVTRIAQAPAYVKGVINLRGTIVPIVDLRLKFGMPERDERSGVVIILDIGGQYMGAAVDAVSDVVVLPPQWIKPAPAFQSAIDAAFIRGIAPVDDRMLIVADIASLLAIPAEAPDKKAA